MKKNGHQIPDRFFITSSPWVSASRLEGKKRKDESRKRISSVKRREISSRNRLSLGDEWKTRPNTLLNAFKSFHQTVKSHEHTRVFRATWERACDKKIINFFLSPFSIALSFSFSLLTLSQIHLIARNYTFPYNPIHSLYLCSLDL